MYEPRFYRTAVAGERFQNFNVVYAETDLWIGVDKASYSDLMHPFALGKVKTLRTLLDHYIAQHRDFYRSLTALEEDPAAPEPVNQMIRASRPMGIGPMSSVAGLFAREIGEAIISGFQVHEIAVENGGDIYLNLTKGLLVGIYAGTSPLSDKIGLQIPAGATPLGICSSSGTVGHSLSFGKADAVTIICENILLADAYATAFSNLVKKPEDIETVLDKIASVSEILGAVVICDDRIGVRGKFKIVLV